MIPVLADEFLVEPSVFLIQIVFFCFLLTMPRQWKVGMEAQKRIAKEDQMQISLY